MVVVLSAIVIMSVMLINMVMVMHLMYMMMGACNDRIGDSYDM